MEQREQSHDGHAGRQGKSRGGDNQGAQHEYGRENPGLNEGQGHLRRSQRGAGRHHGDKGERHPPERAQLPSCAAHKPTATIARM